MLTRFALDSGPDHKENFLKGYKVQRWVLDILDDAKAVEYERDKDGQALRNMPYDITWRGHSIDIKSSWNDDSDDQFMFTVMNAVEPTKHLCEYYLCIGVMSGQPAKAWFIPSKHLDFHTNFTPAIRAKRKSKYDQWLIWAHPDYR